MKIRVVTPITTPGFTEAADLEQLARPDTEVSQANLDLGPASIESAFDEMLAVPDTVAKIMQAEREGVDAVVIDCTGDPGMDAGREATSMLVLDDQQRLVNALAEESVKAVEEDGAHAIVFGCTGMRGCAAGLRATLAERGYPGVPVIDPVIAAFEVAEALVDLGLTPSGRTYPAPREKSIVGYDAVVKATVQGLEE